MALLECIEHTPFMHTFCVQISIHFGSVDLDKSVFLKPPVFPSTQTGLEDSVQSTDSVRTPALPEVDVRCLPKESGKTQLYSTLRSSGIKA